MDAQTVIARRVAQELRSGMLVNLGIGIPTQVANHLPAGLNVFFQSENGLTFVEALAPVLRYHVPDAERDLVLGEQGDLLHADH